jgi:outer membrane protein assembly factor BamA
VQPAFPGIDTRQDEVLESSQKAGEAQLFKGQWLPVPIPVANPTVGSGLQAVLLYLHEKPAEGLPNATSGIAGMYTDTDSWFIGGFHDDNFFADRVRLTVFGGVAQFNLKYYGAGDNIFPGGRYVRYQIKGGVLSPKILFRLPKTEHWFAGLQYLLVDSDIDFKANVHEFELPNSTLKVKTAGMGPLFSYDNRDDNYYPEKGQLFQLRWLNYGTFLGSDFSYDRINLNFNHYQPLNESTVLALRTNFDTVSGDPPFFDLPTFDMRGFPKGRYRDNNTLSLSSEVRYKFHPRWGVVGFVETGWHAGEFDRLLSEENIVSYGTGLRWQMSAQHKIHLGIDLAFSEDDNAVYVRVGEQF